MKLELYYPVKPSVINQGFGSNGDYYRAHGINILGHNGMDFWAQHGQPIYAAHAGVCYTEVDDKSGQGIVIVTQEMYDYEDTQAFFKCIYWHLIDANTVVKTGQIVQRGDLIGYADNTGLSTGDHLHFGLKPMANNEPAFSWVNLEQTNGYLGAIDPAPYFNGKYAHDKDDFHFERDMEMGETSEEVKQLQIKLKRLGYFPLAQEATGFYGSLTRQAVYTFQLENVINLSWMAKYVYRGRYCSEKTRTALNFL